jgi:hypothetical protein
MDKIIKLLNIEGQELYYIESRSYDGVDPWYRIMPTFSAYAIYQENPGDTLSRYGAPKLASLESVLTWIANICSQHGKDFIFMSYEIQSERFRYRLAAHMDARNIADVFDVEVDLVRQILVNHLTFR